MVQDLLYASARSVVIGELPGAPLVVVAFVYACGFLDILHQAVVADGKLLDHALAIFLRRRGNPAGKLLGIHCRQPTGVIEQQVLLQRKE